MATEFGILGAIQVERDGRACDLGSLRQRGLLARLIIPRGQPVSTDRLIEDLWPQEVPDKARHSLHVYVSRLRSSLGPERGRLESDTSGYRLRFQTDELDAARFEGLAAEGRALLAEGAVETAGSRLRDAMAQWRGPALMEFRDEPFASNEATRLEQLRLTALEDRIWADLGSGLQAELTEELRTLTIDQPYRETFWEQLMLALYRAGRQAEALRVYGEARARLADELGIEPGPSLHQMHQRVLEQDPTLSPAASPERAVAAPAQRPPHNLPLQRTTFVGRERDLSIAGELLAQSRLLTLTGAPGSGKTRMALKLATISEHRFPDGIVFVPLAGVSDPAGIDPAIISALLACETRDPTRPRRRRDASAGLVQLLKGRRLLVLLDNLEQIAGAGGPIVRLIDTLPGVTILATSRAPLRVAGEQEYPVLPLSVPPIRDPADPADPAALLCYDAVALLVSRARALDPAFEITAANASAVAGIVARLDGLPLAIELGASRLRIFTPQDLLERLARRLPMLTDDATDTIDRHRTLGQAIAWSHELLDDADRRLFRRLGAFVHGFTAEGAAAVADLPLDETWRGLESLLAKSLIHRLVSVGEARFAMLQTLREFALEQLDAAEDGDATFSRHARYYLDLAEATTATSSEAEADVLVARLIPELEEIRAALDRCAHGGDRQTGMRLAGATWRVWQAAGRLSEGRDWLSLLLETADGSGPARAEALVALAGLSYWQARYDDALECYEEALGIYRQGGEQAREAEVLSGMSMTATWMGDTIAGASLAAEARMLFERLGDRAKVGETLMAQGFALWQERDYAAARPLWEEALAISREVGAEALAVTQLAGVAGIEYHTGHADDATRIAVDALDQACGLANVALCVWLLDFVAAFATARDPAAATRLAGAADTLRHRSGGGNRVEDLHIEPAQVAAARTLDQAELEQAWSQGRGLDLDQAIELARSLRPVSIE